MTYQSCQSAPHGDFCLLATARLTTYCPNASYYTYNNVDSTKTQGAEPLFQNERLQLGAVTSRIPQIAKVAGCARRQDC